MILLHLSLCFPPQLSAVTIPPNSYVSSLVRTHNTLLASQPTITQQQPPWTNSARVEVQDTTIDWLSNVSLVVKPDIREPPMYSGDGDDKYSIQEWIDMMEAYLQERFFSAWAESGALERVLSMLERVLERNNQPAPAVRPKFLLTAQFNHAVSVATHCMREWRCLNCLEQGHRRKDCPKATAIHQSGSSPDQGN